MLAATIDALSDCAQACTADADDNFSEQNLTEMVKCIRLCLNCADVCAAGAVLGARPGAQAGRPAAPAGHSGHPADRLVVPGAGPGGRP